jgi:hypothetical protein
VCEGGGGTKRTQRKVSQGEGTEIWSLAEKGIARRGGGGEGKKNTFYTHARLQPGVMSWPERR